MKEKEKILAKIADIYKEIKDYEGLSRVYKRFIEEIPYNEETIKALWWLANYYDVKGRREEAKIYFEKILEKEERNQWTAGAIYWLARFYEKKNLDKSISLYKKLTSEFPKTKWGRLANIWLSKLGK